MGLVPPGFHIAELNIALAKAPLDSELLADFMALLDPIKWFVRIRSHMVLWWVSEGPRPTLEEALERLARLEARGPTPGAFTIRRRFLPGAQLFTDAEVGCPA